MQKGIDRLKALRFDNLIDNVLGKGSIRGRKLHTSVTDFLAILATLANPNHCGMETSTDLRFFDLGEQFDPFE
jgi:hypothetical protein